MNKGINVRQGESLNPLTLPTSRAIVKPTMLYTFPSAAYGQLKLGWLQSELQQTMIKPPMINFQLWHNMNIYLDECYFCLYTCWK